MSVSFGHAMRGLWPLLRNEGPEMRARHEIREESEESGQEESGQGGIRRNRDRGIGTGTTLGGGGTLDRELERESRRHGGGGQ